MKNSFVLIVGNKWSVFVSVFMTFKKGKSSMKLIVTLTHSLFCNAWAAAWNENTEWSAVAVKVEVVVSDHTYDVYPSVDTRNTARIFMYSCSSCNANFGDQIST